MDIAGQILVVLGGLIFLTAALGVVRLPDLYTRVSAVTTAAGLGIVFVVVGALLLQPTPADTAKVVLAVVLQLATSAVASIAIARSGYLTGTPLARSTRFNDLGEDREQLDR